MHQPKTGAHRERSHSRERTSSRRDLVPPVWLVGLVLAYTVTYSALSIRRHDTFHSYTYDLGIFAQVLWNTAHGRLFEVSLGRMQDTELVGNYLGNHVRPIFLLIAPLYRLWPDPRLLLVLQSAALGLGALPLWWVARCELGHPWLRIAVIVSYLFYPALGYLNLFDFHPVALCIPLLFTAYWALREGRDVAFWTAIVLSLATKEELVVPIAAFGVYCLFQPKFRTRGVALLLLAAAWACLCFLVVIPYYNEGRPYRFFALWSDLTSVLPAMGKANGGELPSGVDLSRTRLGSAYVMHLLLPLGFLPLLSPGLLAVSLPSLAYLLSANGSNLYSIGYQYPAVLIPWLFLAGLGGLARLERRWSTNHRPWACWFPLAPLLVGTLATWLVLDPVRVYWARGAFSPQVHAEQIETALAQIPPEASVATLNPYGPHVAHRRHVIVLEFYPLPLRLDHLEKIDYVLLEMAPCSTVGSWGFQKGYIEMVDQVLATEQYGVQYWSEHILLLSRHVDPDTELEHLRGCVKELAYKEPERRP